MGEQLNKYLERKKRKTAQEAARDASYESMIKSHKHHTEGLDGTCLRCKKQRVKDKTGSLEMCATCYDEKNCPECAKAEIGICLQCFNKLFDCEPTVSKGK
jgi:hypothetical protein